MNVACPECSTVYRVDPARVPERGATVRCRECESAFRVEADMRRDPGRVTRAEAVADAPAAPPAAPDAAESPKAPEAPTPSVPEAPAVASPEAAAPSAGAGGAGGTKAPAFGPQDPETRARRLARALVSDIKVYNPEKWEQSRKQGGLRKDFRDEILKSWEEYVEQVGEEMAKKKPYFRDALNDILAGGERVF